MWVQKGNDIDGEATGDQSGYSVSLSSNGKTVAIGAPFNNGNGSLSGHVRVYSYNTGLNSWVQKGLDIEGEFAVDLSGHSVSLSDDGNAVAIGAILNSSKGHVRVYSFNGSNWVQKGSDIDGEAALDNSGRSVSLSGDGNIVAIGASDNNGNGSFSGHVRVYSYDGVSSWDQKGGDIDGEAAFDNSGYSVSLSSDGEVVAIGASGNDGTAGIDSGHVRVYSYDGASSWVQKGGDIDGEAAGNTSGSSVSLSSDGETVAIGAIFNDDNGITSGHVRIYSYDGVSSWDQKGGDIDGEADGDSSGWSVSLSSDGEVVAIGANGNDGNNGSGSGHVRVYSYSTAGNGSWVQKGLDIDGEAVGDNSGYSVSLSSDGKVVAIGAPNNSSSSGHVRVFSFKTESNINPTLTVPSPSSSNLGLIYLLLFILYAVLVLIFLGIMYTRNTT